MIARFILILVLVPLLQARTVTDHAGRKVSLPDEPRRIISLAPGITETLFALGLGDRVVGVTDYCDYPAETAKKSKVGGMINPSIETIVALKPDLVLHTIEGNRRATLDALERLHINVFVIGAQGLTDVFRMIRDVAVAGGIAARGEGMAVRLERESAALQKAVQSEPPRRVLFLVSLQPIVSVGRGTFLDDILRRAGAESLGAATSQPWPHLSLEEIIRSDPEYVLLPRSAVFAPTRGDLLKLPGWRSVSAVRENRIVYLPAAVERPGPRIIDMQAHIARALHPGAFAATAH